MLRGPLLAGLTLAGLACARGAQSITDGAEDATTWTQRLNAAVSLGMSSDCAQALLRRSGFECTRGIDSAAYLWCEKSQGASHLVRRSWRAVMVLDQDSIISRRATFGLIGP